MRRHSSCRRDSYRDVDFSSQQKERLEEESESSHDIHDEDVENLELRANQKILERDERKTLWQFEARQRFRSRSRRWSCMFSRSSETNRKLSLRRHELDSLSSQLCRFCRRVWTFVRTSQRSREWVESNSHQSRLSLESEQKRQDQHQTLHSSSSLRDRHFESREKVEEQEFELEYSQDCDKFERSSSQESSFQVDSRRASRRAFHDFFSLWFEKKNVRSRLFRIEHMLLLTRVAMYSFDLVNNFNSFWRRLTKSSRKSKFLINIWRTKCWNFISSINTSTARFFSRREVLIWKSIRCSSSSRASSTKTRRVLINTLNHLRLFSEWSRDDFATMKILRLRRSSFAMLDHRELIVNSSHALLITTYDVTTFLHDDTIFFFDRQDLQVAKIVRRVVVSLTHRVISRRRFETLNCIFFRRHLHF